jgi:hypothetical protein
MNGIPCPPFSSALAWGGYWLVLRVTVVSRKLRVFTVMPMSSRGHPAPGPANA